MNAPIITPSLIKAIADHATYLMDFGIEPTSAIKEAASFYGIPYGEPMGKVVKAVNKVLCL
jgi:hypothetical protein